MDTSDQVLGAGQAGRLDSAVVSRLADALGVAGLRQLIPDAPTDRSENAWFRGRAGDAEVFVKLYARPDRGRVEQAVTRALPAGLAPRLVAAGRVAGIGEYSVFEWLPLRTAGWSPTAAAAAGSLLARFHAVAVPADAPPARAPDHADLAGVVERLAEAAPDRFAQYAARLQSRATRELVEAARSTRPQVLVHGDFAFRNLGTASPGRWLLVDFERVRVAPAEFDLDRVWDRELAAPALRRAFLAAYRERSAVRDWPDPAVLRYARLRCALTTVTRGRLNRDEDFERQGCRLLEGLAW